MRIVVIAVLATMLGACDWFVSAQQRIERAEQHAAQGDDRGALIELQNAVRSEPNNVAARLMLADISLRLNDTRSAQRELDLAAEHGASPAQTVELRARALLQSNDADKLLAQMEGGELMLSEPLLSTYRGRALLASGRTDAAIEAFLHALSADADVSAAHRGLAEARITQGDMDAALLELDAALQSNPKDAAALLLKGALLSQRGDFPLAVAALTDAGENAAKQLTAVQRIAVLAAQVEANLGAGALPQAQAAFDELAKRVPDAIGTRLLAARIAMVRQDYVTAAAEAQKVVTAQPQMLAARLMLGSALLAQGNPNQAEAQLAEAVRLAPGNIEARKQLARANLLLQRPDVAAQLLGPAQDGGVVDPQLTALLGWANLQRGETAEAVAKLESSVAAQPSNNALKLDLAAAYLQAGQQRKAVDLLRTIPPSTRRDSLLVASVAATDGPLAARAEIDRAIAARPDDVELLNLAGLVHARLGAFGRAREVLAHALKIDPTGEATLLNQMRVAVAAGDYKVASEAVQTLLAAHPDNGSARLAQAEIAVRTGDTPSAIRQLEEIRAADATAREPRLLLARLYVEDKRTADIGKLIEELRALARNDAAATGALAQLCADIRRYDEALAAFREAARLDSRNPGYSLGVARAQVALGHAMAARETLRKLVTERPDWVPAGIDMVLLDLQEGQRNAAVLRLAEMRKAHPRRADLALLEGDVALQAQDHAAAASAFADAFQLTPTSAAAIRAYRARTLGKLPNAAALVETWLQQHPQDTTARLVVAEARLNEGQPDRAIEQYEQVVHGERPNATALNNLAWLYHQKGDRRAIDTAHRAYQVAPRVASIADTYGWVLLEGGRVEQALPILRQAVADAASGQSEIRLHYAVALTKAGKQAEARTHLTDLAKDATDPNAAQARKLLAELGS